MLTQVLNIVFGSKNDREINQLRPTVTRINELESSVAPLTTAALAEKAVEFHKRIESGESLDDLLPEAFAVCREASRRGLIMRRLEALRPGRCRRSRKTCLRKEC